MGRSVATVCRNLGQLTVAGETAARFGRGREDRDLLYIITIGGLAFPVNGSVVKGGKVVVTDTTKFYTEIIVRCCQPYLRFGNNRANSSFKNIEAQRRIDLKYHDI